MIGRNIRTAEISGSNQFRTACVNRTVHVTFKGENLLVLERERLICMASCDCASAETTASGDAEHVTFGRTAEALIQGYLHPAQTR